MSFSSRFAMRNGHYENGRYDGSGETSSAPSAARQAESERALRVFIRKVYELKPNETRKVASVVSITWDNLFETTPVDSAVHCSQRGG